MIVDERITAYINSLSIELPLYLSTLEKEAVKEEVPIIKKETQSLLRFLLAMKKPAHILEVGTAVGFSALFMSECMPKTCDITTIEKVEMRLVKARVNLKNTDKADKIRLLEGDALVVLKELAEKEGERYDFIFMDAAKAQYMNYLPEVLRLLAPEGLLATDNVLQDGTVAQSRYGITRRDRTIHTRMREYLYTLTHSEQLVTTVLSVGDGVTLSIKQ
ncbi:Predicted O-methyltransferase YrrM [Anaerocolumna jejuensis DSM 15929]|uniref:tRNA 5-hydroxyuridine methyltransferase n=1 Tax=Anaerocolumna jejuensis DSM 15929 TaxID=1121322 RepID=A0A1M6KWR1_9FIRM|nr:O-methyltransferase [Anaerocolumna jejuensis]SHJ63397.1 Predicted O-methyltransferase YrrM [Anaerocolumna jejuensis DSM 15929]